MLFKNSRLKQSRWKRIQMRTDSLVIDHCGQALAAGAFPEARISNSFWWCARPSVETFIETVDMEQTRVFSAWSQLKQHGQIFGEPMTGRSCCLEVLISKQFGSSWKALILHGLFRVDISKQSVGFWNELVRETWVSKPYHLEAL